MAPLGGFYRPTTVIIEGGRRHLLAKGAALDGGSVAAAAAASCKSVAEVLSSTPELSTLSRLSGAVSPRLVAALSDKSDKLTLFAPSNKALQSLLASLPDAGGEAPELVRNVTVLTALLSYHVVPGVALSSAQLTDGAAVPTALGAGVPPLRVRLSAPSKQALLIAAGSEAAVVKPDLTACNGVVHVVDTVLLPVDPAPGRT